MSKKLSGNEIRQTFIDFFVEHGHTAVPSMSLVPGGDSTLLFTNSGMVQFKDVFIGTDTKPYKRAVDSQKCMDDTSALTWARAEPVHLPAIDHLQLAAPVPQPLEPAESAELIDTLNRHLAGSGFRLHARPHSGWLCECPPGLEFTVTEPVVAVGCNLRELLPSGRDAVRVRSLVNELQMMLHEHPVNARRAVAGRATVNSIWLWGAGVAGVPRGATADVLCTDDDWLAGLGRLHGGRAPRPAGEFARSLDEADANLRLAVAPPASGRTAAEDLGELESVVLEPARAALMGTNETTTGSGQTRNQRNPHRRPSQA